jgi:4-hydroxy-3-methylbut-2-enyl diphosphate reductase
MAFENNIEAAASQAPRTAEIEETGRCYNDIERPKDAWRDSEILGYHCRFGGEPMTNASPKSQSEKILLRVRPRGFCAGVVRAVDIVELALEAYGPPVYVHHEIVHNRYVVEQLRKGGAIFVEAVEDVPEGAVLVFSAHGVPPAVRAEAQARRLRVIDATCPLVTKVHLEALKFARDGRTIILIGHKDHQEIVGTSGEAPEQTVVVDSVEAVDRLEVQDSSHLAFLTQTTLSLYDTRDIVARLRQRFPSIVGPASDDICYATQNRQEAVEHMAKEMELILVVGSPNSSNSNRLVEVAERAGVPARLIDDAGGIRPEWLEGVNRVGLTAGASAPEVLVEEVSRRLESFGFTDQRDIDLIREDVRFTLPPELTIIAPLSKQT